MCIIKCTGWFIRDYEEVCGSTVLIQKPLKSSKMFSSEENGIIDVSVLSSAFYSQS